jgi:hypothetical protein
MSKRSLAIYSLACALFLTITGSAHTVAFSLESSIQPVQQGIPGLGIPGQGQQQQQQQPQVPAQQQEQPQQQQQQQPQVSAQQSLPSPPTPSPSAPPAPAAEAIPPQQQQQRPNQGIIAKGIIDSLILTPTATWIATGNWTVGVNNDNAALFASNMTWYNDNGTSSHTHEILNFRPFAAVPGQGEQPILVQPSDNSVSLRGVLDIGANHRISWTDVQSAIDIKKGGRILSISLDDAQTNDHFGGRPIFGIVTSFTRCSDVPGPNMEMLQPCLNIPVVSPSPAPQPTITAAPPSPSTAAPAISPPPSAPPTNNNTVQNPATSPPQSLQSTPPSIPGNTATTIRPPAVSNATGKSPFDILGGAG